MNSAQQCNNLTRDERQALKRLREDESIVIVPSDKGKQVVVMNKVEYISKVEEHLDDSDTYDQLDCNPM